MFDLGSFMNRCRFFGIFSDAWAGLGAGRFGGGIFGFL